MRCGVFAAAVEAARKTTRNAAAAAATYLLMTMKDLRLEAEGEGSAARAARTALPPRADVRRRGAGDLARPRRASQLRDSAGIAPASLAPRRPGIWARQAATIAHTRER